MARLQKVVKINTEGNANVMGMPDLFTQGSWKGFPLISVILADPEYVMKEIEQGCLKIIPRAMAMLERELGPKDDRNKALSLPSERKTQRIEEPEVGIYLTEGE